MSIKSNIKEMAYDCTQDSLNRSSDLSRGGISNSQLPGVSAIQPMAVARLVTTKELSPTMHHHLKSKRFVPTATSMEHQKRTAVGEISSQHKRNVPALPPPNNTDYRF